MIEDNYRILDWHINEGVTQHYAEAALGWIPSFLSEDDPRPAHEQFDERYIGGWNPMLPGKFKMDQDLRLYYPGDPPMVPVASAMCHSERIIVYPHGWVAILTSNGRDFSVARMD